jgi:hypothetical protein
MSETIMEATGITAATGERAETLRALSDAAFEAIKIIELERSGIRDGDGFWHGADVIGHITGRLADLCERLMEKDRPGEARRSTNERVVFQWAQKKGPNRRIQRRPGQIVKVFGVRLLARFPRRHKAA